MLDNAEQLSVQKKTNELKILVGENRKLVALANDTVEMAEWESLTPDIVSVDEFGLVTGLSVGEGILKATADGKYYDICNVTVYEMTKEEVLKKVNFVLKKMKSMI